VLKEPLNPNQRNGFHYVHIELDAVLA